MSLLRSPRGWWLALACYAAALVGSAPYARSAVVSLREWDLLGLSISSAYIVAAGVAGRQILMDRRLSDAMAFGCLVILTGVAGTLLMGISIPEERIHFLQYGFLAWLALRALEPRLEPWKLQVVAFVGVALLGLCDELYQGWLPNRVFDWRDVGLNAIGALFTVVVWTFLQRAQHRVAQP